MRKIGVWCSIFLFLSGCGLPDASYFETLGAPVLIDDKTEYPKCFYVSGGGVRIQLEMMVYNTESTFSGYNIYLLTQFSGLDDLKSQLMTAVADHLVQYSSSRNFNTTIESTFIIKHNTSLPTIPIGDSSIVGYNQQPITAIITLTRTPQNRTLQEVNYGFTATAVSLSNTQESVAGGFIWVNATNINSSTDSAGVYCGGTSS